MMCVYVVCCVLNCIYELNSLWFVNDTCVSDHTQVYSHIHIYIYNNSLAVITGCMPSKNQVLVVG